MDSYIELFHEGTWHRAASLTVDDGLVQFGYEASYVFGPLQNPPCVALSLPVELTRRTWTDQAVTPLAFLWDLVPQGRGRDHIAGLLNVPSDSSRQDLYLAQHGAFAPIGRLRLDTAVDFYNQHTAGMRPEGFTTQEMHDRSETFVDQLRMYNMLAAGTPGVQGIAPKFLLTQDEEGRWFPDVGLADEHARQHWIVKLSRGTHADDQRILRHESIYLQAAAACGIRTIDAPEYRDDMLFLRRFDREVDAAGSVRRLHQETLAALIGYHGFARSASLFALTERLAQVASDPAQAVAEFLCRDVLNRALRNPDNHLRNTSVQQNLDGTVQLTPLYDFGPMYLDRALISRTCEWRLPNGGSTDNWNEILETLALDDDVKAHAAGVLRSFGEDVLPALPHELRFRDADADIVEICKTAIGYQIPKLQDIDCRAAPSP
ncbi:HipA domain-containing protein [Luteimonas sp. SMYT11W]|uniref:HipA domain-containing protein n=1 Tax=Luteimonas flava TaxID=3115822 RepID=A0ABU7WDP9_9GAMM